jgi:DNA anti-recombination protein RmuC
MLLNRRNVKQMTSTHASRRFVYITWFLLSIIVSIQIHDEYKIKMERIVQENANLQAEIERLKTGCLTAQSSTTTKLFASSLKQAQELSQTLLGQLDATQAELDEMKKAVQEAKKCEAERASDVSQEMQNIIETNTELENETKKLQQQLRVANRDRKELDGLLTTALGEVEKVIRETRETRMLFVQL